MVREPALDTDRTASMASAEAVLWQNLSSYHVSLAHEGLPIQYINDAYRADLARRQNEVYRLALRDILDEELSSVTRIQALHGHRRVLAMLQQEEELIDTLDGSARAIAEDRAFIALGRRSVVYIPPVCSWLIWCYQRQYASFS